MGRGVAARVIAHAGWTADSGVNKGTVKAYPFGGERIQIGGTNMRVPVAGQVISPQLIGHDEQDVLALCHVVCAAGLLRDFEAGGLNNRSPLLAELLNADAGFFCIGRYGNQFILKQGLLQGRITGNFFNGRAQ